MSKRFGRNQRRELRAELARASAEIEGHLSNRRALEHFNRELRRDLETLRDGIVRYLGDNHMLLNPTNQIQVRHIMGVSAAEIEVSPRFIDAAHDMFVDRRIINPHRLLNAIELLVSDDKVRQRLRAQVVFWQIQTGRRLLTYAQDIDVRDIAHYKGEEIAQHISKSLVRHMQHDLKRKRA